MVEYEYASITTAFLNTKQVEIERDTEDYKYELDTGSNAPGVENV